MYYNYSMHSFLFVGNDNLSVKKEIDIFVKEKGGKLIEFEAEKIENIRDMKHFTGLAAKEETYIYLPNTDKASEAAQNALLKSLEEPQQNITFVLSAENEYAVLETIRSRCEVIRVKNAVPDEDKNFFQEFINSSVGEKFTKISSIKKREEAVEMLTKLINGGRADLRILESANIALNNIRENGNVQIQLVNFLAKHLSITRH